MSRLSTATWPEIAADRRTVLIWPLGATEQHGPHLPLATDTVIAERVAARVHELRPGSGLAPALAIGASGEHADFPGTLSMGTDALARVIIEVVRDSARWWPAVLIVNGHGGNLEAVSQARSTCAGEGRAVGVVHLGLPGMDAHAGHSETSLLLHLAPELVRLERAEAGSVAALAPVSELLDRLRQSGVAAVSPNGVLGDPTRADARHGAELFAGLVDRALAAHDTCLPASPP